MPNPFTGRKPIVRGFFVGNQWYDPDNGETRTVVVNGLNWINIVRVTSITPGYRCEIENIGASRRTSFEYRIFKGKEVFGKEAEGVTVEFIASRQGILSRQLIPPYFPPETVPLSDMENWEPPEGEGVISAHFYYHHWRAKCYFLMETAPIRIRAAIQDLDMEAEPPSPPRKRLVQKIPPIHLTPSAPTPPPRPSSVESQLRGMSSDDLAAILSDETPETAPLPKYAAEDLSDLSKNRLKEMCREDELAVSGTKKKIIERLLQVPNPFSTTTNIR